MVGCFAQGAISLDGGATVEKIHHYARKTVGIGTDGCAYVGTAQPMEAQEVVFRQSE